MYTNYSNDRVLPTYPIQPSYESYMKVEPVLRYLNLKGNPLTTQYTLISDGKPIEGNFFKIEDLKKKIDARLFRAMECEVTTHMIEIK